MIRSVPRAEFSFRTKGGAMGAIPGIATSFNPISTGIGLATSAIGDWMASIQLSHDADTATTLIVNGLAEQLQNLDNAYFAEPNPTCADQWAALDAYDQAWLWLQSPQACGAPTYGAAGNRCITDRAPNGKYPWKTYYRDPIANDPRMAGKGCDTGLTVILPTVQGGYQNTGISSTGGSSTTGQPATAAPPIAAPAQLPASVTSNPPVLLIAGALVGGILLSKLL